MFCAAVSTYEIINVIKQQELLDMTGLILVQNCELKAITDYIIQGTDVWVGSGGNLGVGIGRGCAPSAENFSIFEWNRGVLMHSGTLF